jgi:hypothetical protein
MLKTLVSSAGALALMTNLAFAQAMPVRPVNGAVVSTSDTSVTLKDKDGKDVVVAMKPGWVVVANRDVSSDTLKVGDFIGAGNTVVDANTGVATEMRIYEPGNKPEEGTHPLSAGNPVMMTHGTVSKITKVDGARKVEVTYPGGGRTLTMADTVQVVASIPIGRERAAPGTVLGAVTRQDKDGVWRAERLQINERAPRPAAAAPAAPAAPR